MLNLRSILVFKVVAEPCRMDEGADGWIATSADPDGNCFQLMTPWEG